MKNNLIKNIVADAMFLSLFCALAFSINISVLKFTLQLMIVFIVGLLLPLRNSLIIVISYIILGLIGLPIFAGYMGGISYIAMPTFGFVYGFIPGVIVLELLKKFFITKTNKKIKIFGLFLSCFACQIVCYICGFIHGYYILNIQKESGYTFISLMNLFIIPYIPIDILKAIIAILAFIGLERPYQKIMNNYNN